MQAGTSRAPSGARRTTRWLAVGGAVLVAIGALSLEGLVRRYLFAESIQFCAFAMAIPALIALGVTWRPRRGLPFGAVLAVGAVFVGLCVLWRLPPVLDALARHPVLQAPELVTLLLAGAALWLHLVSAPSRAGRGAGPARPQRAAMAAVTMWAIWGIAYVLGFANHAVIHAYDQSGSLGVVTDQEITAALLWAVSAACFVPVVYVCMFGWLRTMSTTGGRPAQQSQAVRDVAPVRGWARPSRPR